MKRLLFLMLLCSPLLFTSCEENYFGSLDTYYETVYARDWYEVGTLGQPGYHWEAYIPTNYITTDVMNNGAVLVYAIYDELEADIQLPDVYSDRIGGSEFVQILGYQLVHGGIYFTIEASDFEAAPFTTAQEFKIVVIR